MKAQSDGYVNRILAEEIGTACMQLGGGRENKDSEIDLSVGIMLKKKNGDAVSAGEPLAVLCGNDEKKLHAAANRAAAAFEIGKERKEPDPVIYRRIDA